MSQQKEEVRRSSTSSAEHGPIRAIDGNIELDDVGASVSEERREEESEAPPKEMLGVTEYTALDLDTQEMRFLILMPHCGEVDSLITCSLSTEPLMECEPYTAVVNTRGNPFHHAIIKINGMGMWLPWNIFLFLRHIRSESDSKRLWFRDVC
jgi:hypothetical protein